MLTGKLTKRQVGTLGPGRHGDGGGLYLVVDPSGARRWILRVVVKGQTNRNGGPLRTDFGLGGADVVTLHEARERALEYRRLAKRGINPRLSANRAIPSFEDISRQVHIDRLPTWKNAKHGQQWINTLRDYAFPKIGRLPVSEIGQPEVLACLSPIWTEKPETAKRLMQRIRTVLDVARSKGYRDGENPVAAIKATHVLPKVKKKPKHHSAMDWRAVPAFYADLGTRSAMAAKALMFTCLISSGNPNLNARSSRKRATLAPGIDTSTIWPGQNRLWLSTMLRTRKRLQSASWSPTKSIDHRCMALSGT
jgi:hypothetical protein